MYSSKYRLAYATAPIRMTPDMALSLCAMTCMTKSSMTRIPVGFFAMRGTIATTMRYMAIARMTGRSSSLSSMVSIGVQ